MSGSPPKAVQFGCQTVRTSTDNAQLSRKTTHVSSYLTDFRQASQQNVSKIPVHKRLIITISVRNLIHADYYVIIREGRMSQGHLALHLLFILVHCLYSGSSCQFHHCLPSSRRGLTAFTNKNDINFNLYNLLDWRCSRNDSIRAEIAARLSAKRSQKQFTEV